jgi:hypothetical protein
MVREAFAEVGLAMPSKKDVVEALEHYRMFSEKELEELRGEFQW